MKLKYSFCLFFVFYIRNITTVLINRNQYTYKVKNFSLRKCSDNIEPIQVENVSVSTASNGDLNVSGTLFSSVNLESPIQISVNMKRKILGIWITVPCIDNVGSCTYGDVCSYGIPDNHACPKKFIENNIPCRCPIEKGNYTLPKQFLIPKELYEENIMSGKYTARITVHDATMHLACYNAYFILY